jgi:uncharacterized protein YbjT (DUF2867 family)
MEKVLVTGVGGGTGGVGNKVAEHLLAAKVPVRAMALHEDESVKRIRDLGAEVVIGDLTDLGDVHRAVRGSKRLYFGMSVSPVYLEAAVNVAAVAKHYGIEAMVSISQMTVSEMSIDKTTDSPQQKFHWLVEQVLTWSGLPVVQVRSTVFLEHPFFYAWAIGSIAKAGEIRLPFGSARTSPIATQDVAEAIATILMNPAEHIGKTYQITGARSESMAEIAAEYAEALHRPVRYVDVPLDIWKANELPGKGLPTHVAHHISTMAALHHDNRYDRWTDDLRTITGHGAISVGDWVRSHSDEFSANPH